jgi:hypothetical protein
MSEQAIEIENEIEKDVAEPLSLRDQISSARNQIREKEKTSEDIAKSTQKKELKLNDKPKLSRDDKGKFSPKEQVGKISSSPRETQFIEQPKEEVKEEPTIPMPSSFTGAVKSKWNELPADVRQDILNREQEFHKKLTGHDEDRDFGRQVQKIVTPYLAQIKAEGATAPQAIENLLNMAHVLRVGSPQQKSDLLLRTAETFGVDLRQAMQQMQQPQNPQLNALMQEVHNLKLEKQREEALRKQTEESSIQQTIEEFRSNPENIHFETVKAHMASLLSSGLAKDLKDAYDQAVYANPQTRTALLEQQLYASSGKRVAETKARADAARRAGSSIKGAPGVVASQNQKIQHSNLNSAIRAALAEHRGEA